MATIRSYTTIEQSKVLAEILPLESADMWFANGIIVARDSVNEPDDIKSVFPCWSLAALLGIYPMIVGRDMDMYYCWQNHKNLHSKHYDNPVDACVDMIEKLHGLKML